ncbi:MAG: hypothetical protein MOB07_26190 [Acidobacteria bacterium]|nr:hypothetical protein [Acidobacteriota bacterium]
MNRRQRRDIDLDRREIKQMRAAVSFVNYGLLVVLALAVIGLLLSWLRGE